MGSSSPPAQIRERLIREMKTNISIRVEETGEGTPFFA